MDLNALLPLLDSVSKFAETLPFPWVAFAGVVLASAIAVFKQFKATKDASKAPEVVQAPVVQLFQDAAKPQDQAKTPDTEAKTAEIVQNTLKP